VPNSQGTPAWIDAAHFNIADHVILAPADRPLTDENYFLAWCARRSVIPLDRNRPLWRLDIVPGLPSRQVGLLLVLHHVVADGLRGVTLVTSLLEPTPREQPIGQRTEVDGPLVHGVRDRQDLREIGRLPCDATQVMRLDEIKALLAPDRIEVALRTVIEVRSSGRGWADHRTAHLSSCLGRVDSADR
jgi:Wax ester synthase/diacylglycerol acyltransferase catalytic domain